MAYAVDPHADLLVDSVSFSVRGRLRPIVELDSRLEAFAELLGAFGFDLRAQDFGGAGDIVGMRCGFCWCHGFFWRLLNRGGNTERC